MCLDLEEIKMEKYAHKFRDEDNPFKFEDAEFDKIRLHSYGSFNTPIVAVKGRTWVSPSTLRRISAISQKNPHDWVATIGSEDVPGIYGVLFCPYAEGEVAIITNMSMSQVACIKPRHVCPVKVVDTWFWRVEYLRWNNE